MALLSGAVARLLPLVLVAVIAVSCTSPQGGPPTTDPGLPQRSPVVTPAPGLPNIVLIITDDQRWDTLWAMPILQERLA